MRISFVVFLGMISYVPRKNYFDTRASVDRINLTLFWCVIIEWMTNMYA